MEEENQLQRFLVKVISFFVGIYLVVHSVFFLYFNETIQQELPKSQISAMQENGGYLEKQKVFTYDSKELFLAENTQDFSPATWILRGIGFFALWFGFTLFLVALKEATTKLGIFSLVFSILGAFLVVFFSKVMLFMLSGKNALNNLGESVGQAQENIFSNFFSSIFLASFWEELFGVKIDIYFLYFLLFLFCLLLYFLFPKIKKRIPARKQKSSFKKYDK